MSTVAGTADDKRLRDALHEHGMRCTTPRLQVVGTLRTSGQHQSADEIAARMLANGARVDMTTTYRTLTTLQMLGLVHELALTEQPVRYGLASHPHHHAICTTCGATTEINATQLADAVKTASQASAYLLSTNASLQLHGTCPACQTLKSKPAARASR